MGRWESRSGREAQVKTELLVIAKALSLAENMITFVKNRSVSMAECGKQF